MDSPYFVYVLYSKVHKRYYTGSSSDPYKRLNGHNDPRSKGWTSRYAPWNIIHVEECDSKSDALRKEKWLKSGAGREFIKSIHFHT